MARKKLDMFDDMFNELNKRAAGEKPEGQPAAQTVVEKPVQQQPAAPSVPTEQEKQVLQGKQAKQGKNTEKKEYDYGTKHTFPIPDDLWNDALIVMQAAGKKQVEWINDLIRQAVEINRPTIEAVKKLRGDL